jgi:uncharacterized protein YqjF (DUF2071 family)
MSRTLPSDESDKIGSTLYYVARHDDFKVRHPKLVPPPYYLDYGTRYLKRFHNLRPQLSPDGQVWVDRTAVLLQQKIESRRKNAPIEFDDLERHAERFRKFAFETHPKAYLEGGLAELPAEDIILISRAPDARDLLSDDGMAQVVTAAMAVVVQNGPTRNAKLVADATMFLSKELALRAGDVATDELDTLLAQVNELQEQWRAIPATTPNLLGGLMKFFDPAAQPVTTPGQMRQGWRNLGFCSWKLPAEQVRLLVPAELELDLRDGHAWVSMVPMLMVDVGAPDIGAVLPAFAEINLRVYVRCGGQPGVHFLSLDCPQGMVNLGANVLFGLPYVLSLVSLTEEDAWLLCESERIDPTRPPARLRCRYQPSSPATPVQPGSLEQFLVERYSLFTVDPITRAVHRGDILHEPWLVAAGQLSIDENTIPVAAGLPIDRPPDHFCFSTGVDTITLPFKSVP